MVFPENSAVFIIILVKAFKVKTSRQKVKTMTHFAGENWNGNHLPNASAVYNSEVPFPQIWNQEGTASYNDIIGFQDLGEKKY
jgi:predicted metalloprotease with PDZ domain